MQKKNTSLYEAAATYKFIANMYRWKYSALAAAAAAFLGLHAPSAFALALGPITVQSALGEPLRAEIELPQITPEEADSLRAATAAPEVFRAQGLEYSSTANKVRMQLHRRPDGRTVLRLSSSTPVQDPFVDFVVDARWNKGHITRSYTMLFDPPALRRAPVTVAAPAQMAAPASSPSVPAARTRPAVVARAPVAEAAATSTPATTTTTRAAGTAPATSDGTLSVKQGDTAGRIAGSYRQEGVSLDQMLVAMLRANPSAFIGGNVNRIKAGAVLQMPNQEEALATPAGEARKILAVQSRDFNTFRQKLAQSAPAAQQAAAERSASGSVQARTDDTSANAAAPDKLTLSKGAMQGKKSTEELLAQRKQGSAASARAEELAKNIDELSKLSAASTLPAGGAPATGAEVAATGAGPAVPNPGIAVPAATADLPATSTPATEAPAQEQSAPEAGAPDAAADDASTTPADGAATEDAPQPTEATPPPAPAPVPVPAPAPQPSFLSELMEDPMVPLAGGGLLLLLAGYGAYRVVQRRRNAYSQDSGFLDSRVHADSFFGASGGQRVDTAGSDTTTGGSSLAFSHSQLDAGGDVDPVAEADVYLAYGRDLQAEEILKEAVRHSPTRVSVHAKLGEIYAKRQDRKALEAAATDVYKLTQGQGLDWARMVDLGSTLDPENPLYRPGGQPTATTAPVADSGFASTFTAHTEPVASAAPSNNALDLDLDFDLPEGALTEAPSAPAPSFSAAPVALAAAQATASATDKPVGSNAPAARGAMAPSAMDANDIDLDDTARAHLSPATVEIPQMTATAPQHLAGVADTVPQSLDHLDFSMDQLPALDIPSASTPAAGASAEAAFEVSDSGLLEFDLDALSLDLDTPEHPAPAGASSKGGARTAEPAAEDPLATKLALAQEFNTIGDSEGARTLIEEVIAESSGSLKARAQRLLAELD